MRLENHHDRAVDVRVDILLYDDNGASVHSHRATVTVQPWSESNPNHERVSTSYDGGDVDSWDYTIEVQYA